MLPKSKVLILKFPEKSRLTGVEKHTLKVFELMASRGLDFCLVSSCAVTLSEFRKSGWRARRFWAGLEPQSRASQWLFLLTWPAALVALLGLLIGGRLRGYNKIYCLTLTEKILLTPWARLLGYKVIWAEILAPQQTILDNPYNFLYKSWSGFTSIVAISNFVKRELIDWGVDEKNVAVVYDGVDPEKFKKQLTFYDLLAAQQKATGNASIFRCGFIGQLSNVKGLHVLIQAIAKVQEQIPQILLTIVGEGEARAHLEWLIRQLNLSEKIKLVGYKEDFLNWIWNFNLFILPSLNESLGIAAIEASACAKPVIATKVGGLPEVIESEQSGLLVAPESSDDLARAILMLYQDPAKAKRLALAGRQRVEKLFSLATMQQEYWKIFNDN